MQLAIVLTFEEGTPVDEAVSAAEVLLGWVKEGVNEENLRTVYLDHRAPFVDEKYDDLPKEM